MTNSVPAIASRVLVVDDDPIFVEMAISCLSGAGFATHAARDGAEAIDLLERESFQCALIDLVMPRVDGFRLIALIRATPSLRKLPILVISSRQDVAAFEEALTVGADAFQTKPINWSLLPTQIRYVLRGTAGSERLPIEAQASLERTPRSGGLRSFEA